MHTVGLPYQFYCFFLEILKKKIKKKLWKWPVDWSFSELYYLFFLPPDPKSEKKILVNQLIK